MDPGPSFFEIQTHSAWGRTLTRFAEWTPPPPSGGPARALDVGCGPGLLPSLLMKRGWQAYGVDLDPAALRHGLHPALAQADALRLPFPAAAFNLVCACNLLFLLPDPAAALREMRRLLAPRGTLALLNPSERMSMAAATAVANDHALTGVDRSSLLGWARRAEAHRRWNEAETRVLLASAGLALTETTLRVGPGLARWTKALKEG